MNLKLCYRVAGRSLAPETALQRLVEPAVPHFKPLQKMLVLSNFRKAPETRREEMVWPTQTMTSNSQLGHRPSAIAGAG